MMNPPPLPIPKTSKLRFNRFPWNNISHFTWSSWTMNLNSDLSSSQNPPDKWKVPTKRWSLKVSTQTVGVRKGYLYRTHFCLAHSVRIETQKWPQENTLCAHLSVAWWFVSPRPLGVATGGPRLLKTTSWTLWSASRAAHGNKIYRRVHW